MRSRNDFILLILVSCFLCFSAASQNCIPEANCANGDFINDVEIGNYQRLNSGAENCQATSNPSYTFTSTTLQAQIGSSLTLSAKSGSGLGQYFGFWADWNGNGDFTDAGEFLFSSSIRSTAAQKVTLQIPQFAVAGKVVIRIRCKFDSQIFANESCTNFLFGETEDYEIALTANTVKPKAGFTANTQASCGDIQFINTSSADANGFVWDFGDGNSSTNKNPAHTYLDTGKYTVSLISTNSNGADTLGKQDFIEITPKKAPFVCSATTTNSPAIANTGIKRIKFHELNHSSSSSLSEGYENNECFLNRLENQRYYPIFIETFEAFAHDIEVWIDLNGNATFDANERVLSKRNTFILEDSIYIPPFAIIDSAIRMRVFAEPSLVGINAPCGLLQNGQAEDYSLLISTNNNPPEAQFTLNKTTSCDGVISFFDRSNNQVTNWYWEFGDGNVSTLKNPVHQYANNGKYTVKLIASNAFGSDTAIKNSVVNITRFNNLPSACEPTTIQYLEGYGILEVRGPNLNSVSNNASVGYEDFSCERVFKLRKGNTYNFQVKVGSPTGEDLQVWLDQNGDGIFNSDESLYFGTNKTSHSFSYTVPDTGILVNTNLRLRFLADSRGNITGPCANPRNSQAEDYGVAVISSSPKARFAVDTNNSCSGKIRFTNLSFHAQTLHWFFGDGRESFIENPTHQYSDTGNYDITLVVSNGIEFDTLRATKFISYNQNECGGLLLSEGNEVISHACEGTLNDFGNDFLNSKSASATLIPQGASILTLQFQRFDLGTADTLEIYDGPGAFGTKIGSFTGSNLPGGGSITCNSGAAYLKLIANSSNRSGFGLTWQCNNSFEKPKTFFTSDSTDVCVGFVHFYDFSTQQPLSWFWNFGDGSTSTLQHPTHQYTSTGKYDVQLVSSNAFGSDTLKIENYVERGGPQCASTGYFKQSNSKNSYVIYPNPAQDYITLQSKNGTSESVYVEIFSLNGNFVKAQRVYPNTEVDIRALNKGVYLIKVTTNKSSVGSKLIKL